MKILTGHDGIATDAIRSKSDGAALHQALHPGFRRCVVDLLPASHDCADGTQRDDTTSLAVYELLLDHLLGDGLGQEESAVQVHRLGFQVQLGGQGEEGVEGADPGVGYKGVDPVECPHCRLDDLVSAKDVPASYRPR